MKKILFILSFAILIPFTGNSQKSPKYVGVQSLRIESNEDVTNDATTAGKWLSWTTFSGSYVNKFGSYEQYGPFLRFAAEDLTEYVGQKITRMRFRIGNATTEETVFLENPKVQIFIGGSVDFSDPEYPVYDPGALMYEQILESYSQNGQNYANLPTPITIPANQELWFGVIYSVQSGYPMLTIDHEKPTQLATCHPYKSDLVFFGDTEEWASMKEINDGDYSWVQAVYLDIAECSDASDLAVTYDATCTSAVLTWNAPSDNPTATYNVYRGTVPLNTTPITETTFTATGFDPLTAYTWTVKVICPSQETSAGISKQTASCTTCTAPNLEVAYIDNCETAKLTWTSDAPKFNVYRDSDKVASEITEKTYLYIEQAPQTAHLWKVEAICELANNSTTKTLTKCVGINEFELSSFTIVPNPATDHIIVSTPVNVNFNTIEIVNFLGQTVVLQPVDKNSVQVDVSNLTSGVYFVRIASEKETSVKKFVKK
jgi:hypothetical protein